VQKPHLAKRESAIAKIARSNFRGCEAGSRKAPASVREVTVTPDVYIKMEVDWQAVEIRIPSPQQL
jgi:hypothetical protein